MEKKAKCVRSVLSTFFPTFPFSPLSLQLFLPAPDDSRCVSFPPVSEDIWLWSQAICMPACCLLGLPAPGAAVLLPRSRPWLSCPIRCWMEGRGAGREQFCFLPDEYSLDVKLLNADKTLLPSKYVSHIKALRKVKKGIHTLFLPSSPRFNLKKYLFSLYSEQRKK